MNPDDLSKDDPRVVIYLAAKAALPHIAHSPSCPEGETGFVPDDDCPCGAREARKDLQQAVAALEMIFNRELAL